MSVNGGRYGFHQVSGETEGKPRSTVDRQEMSRLLRCGRLLQQANGSGNVTQGRDETDVCGEPGTYTVEENTEL